MTVKINNIPGQIPEVWDRSVLFFANILSLFFGNESETEVLRKEVGALETYGSRLIPLVNLIFKGKDNYLILEKKPDETLLDYFREQLNLQLPQLKIVDHNVYQAIMNKKSPYAKDADKFIHELNELSAQWIDGYVTDNVLVELAKCTSKKTVSSGQGSRDGNNKLLLNEYLLSSGLPVFDTCIAQSSKEIPQSLDDLRQRGYHFAVIKSSIGASGIGMVKVDLSNSNDIKMPDYFFYEGPCLIQGWLDDSVEGVEYITSPSVQMFLNEDSICLHDITEQILSKDSIHEGNLAPAPCLAQDFAIESELLGQGKIVSQWLHDLGYRGTASADFHLIRRNGTLEVRVCEINARVTGATYPSILAHHFLPGKAWLMRNIRFSPAIESRFLLDVLDREELLFHPGKSQGVLPFNFNPNEERRIVKGQFLFVGENIGSVQALLKRMCETPSIQGDYDRD